MHTYIALVRGINVGGRNKLRMKALATLLEGLGLRNVKTYIQSGNVVFQSEPVDKEALATDIATAIEENYGFGPRVMILSAEYFQQALADNPYPQAEDAPKSVHLYFLASPATDPDLSMLREYQKENEEFVLTENVFYLYAPDGIGRSKLAERVEKALGVPATARNWRTASKIRDMLRELEN